MFTGYTMKKHIGPTIGELYAAAVREAAAAAPAWYSRALATRVTDAAVLRPPPPPKLPPPPLPNPAPPLPGNGITTDVSAANPPLSSYIRAVAGRANRRPDGTREPAPDDSASRTLRSSNAVDAASCSSPVIVTRCCANSCCCCFTILSIGPAG